MAIDLTVMRKRLEEKQAEIQQHIATLTGSPAQPEDAIQASDDCWFFPRLSVPAC
ncbi:MAG TPA: hypothetical protein VEI53_09005 [Ktedonobacteraceae bacterium]|nr:hypothetical protein [Ktedonobacteraceae bacterium]